MQLTFLWKKVEEYEDLMTKYEIINTLEKMNGFKCSLITGNNEETK
jgi:hypothetical protein